MRQIFRRSKRYLTRLKRRMRHLRKIRQIQQENLPGLLDLRKISIIGGLGYLEQPGSLEFVTKKRIFLKKFLRAFLTLVVTHMVLTWSLQSSVDWALKSWQNLCDLFQVRGFLLSAKNLQQLPGKLCRLLYLRRQIFESFSSFIIKTYY